MKRILVNATQQEELRVAMVDGQELYDLDIELTGDKQKKSNIYKAKIVRVEPSLEAAFVDYGVSRHGFLPLREIAPRYFRSQSAKSIQDMVRSGQELIVQISQDERGNKGAALTTFPSLPGRYLVLTPNNPRSSGISRQIEGEDRNKLQEIRRQLDIQEQNGVIIRTAGIGHSIKELQWDLDNQVRLWNAICEAAETVSVPALLYSDNDPIVRALRDNLRDDIGEVLIDEKEMYERACEFVDRMAPQHRDLLKLYEGSTPLFGHHQIESQVETVHDRVVRLPSGGTIAIDHTEALVAIDINSARATRGSDIEVTALTTNLEAASEIARQLRLRDLNGLLVIDFIDMASSENQRKVENELREQVQKDRARVQLGKISRFGMLELSRQRLRVALGETMRIPCTRCEGIGSIRTLQSLSLSILRLIEEEALKQNTGLVVAEIPAEIAAYLLNEKRDSIDSLVQRYETHIRLLPDSKLEFPHYRIHRYRDTDPIVQQAPDYTAPQAEMPASPQSSRQQRYRAESRPALPAMQPVVDVTEHVLTPPKETRKKESLWKVLLLKLMPVRKPAPSSPKTRTRTEEPQPSRNRNRRRRRRRPEGDSSRTGQGQGQGQGQRRQARTTDSQDADSQGEKPRSRSRGRRRRRPRSSGEAGSSQASSRNSGNEATSSAPRSDTGSSDGRPATDVASGTNPERNRRRTQSPENRQQKDAAPESRRAMPAESGSDLS